MTVDQSTRSDVVLVGIDIAEHRHEVPTAAPGKARRRRLTILNTRAEFDRLVGLMVEYDPPIRVAFKGQTMGLAAITTARWPTTQRKPGSRRS